MSLSRRSFVKHLGMAAASFAFYNGLKCGAPRKPNFIIIFCDDLGYGDLGAFGHPTLKTPNLDRMAQEGQKWTQFYAAASVCTPSRAAILTGRLPIRSGMCSAKRRVLFPDSAGGLPDREITLAEALKKAGYATACVGKWHLGHLPSYLPTQNGFDSYFGIPYSNDMDAVHSMGRGAFREPKTEYWNVPLMRNEEIIERPADQHTITRRYTEESVKFIKNNKDKAFFLYLAHNMPHVPLFASEQFKETSRRGHYGDVVEEIDWSVGRILDTLREEGLAGSTLVVFTSDNGPWLIFDEQGGSAGLLRGGKGATWEGGMREPTIFWQPGLIGPGVVAEMGSTLDLMPTFCGLAGAELPGDRVIDGVDLSPVLHRTGPGPRHTMFYYREAELYAARVDQYKVHFITKSAYGADRSVTYHDPPLLYDLEHDPSEKIDLSADHPEVIERIKKEVEKHRATVKPVKDQLVERIKTE